MAAPMLEARAHSGPSYTTLLDSTKPWDRPATMGRRRPPVWEGPCPVADTALI